MKKLLTVQVTSDGHRDPTPSETVISHTINGLKRKIKTSHEQALTWICIAGDKELTILDLFEAKHNFVVLRYVEHEVIGDD